jgi:hypothetical protein
LLLDGHSQGFQGNLDIQRVAHGTSPKLFFKTLLAGTHVEDGGKVEPNFAGRDVSEVGKPDLVWSLRCEVALLQVGRDGIVMAAIRRSCLARQSCQSARIPDHRRDRHEQ